MKNEYNIRQEIYTKIKLILFCELCVQCFKNNYEFLIPDTDIKIYYTEYAKIWELISNHFSIFRVLRSSINTYYMKIDISGFYGNTELDSIYFRPNTVIRYMLQKITK